MKIRVVGIDVVASWVSSIRERGKFSMAFIVLFIGDRLSCCDEAVALEVDGEIVGMATIAPYGEERSGQPTIVGHYVLPEHRRAGLGTALLEAAVRRCLARRFSQIRVDAMSKAELRCIARLPEELRAALNVHDWAGDTESLD